MEAIAFLGAVAVFLLLLLAFALYLNKALCFASCGGFPCIDQVPKKDTSALGKPLPLPLLSVFAKREREFVCVCVLSLIHI